MKHLILLLAISVIGITCYGQFELAPEYPNTQLYNETVIHRLKDMVDSLHRLYGQGRPVKDYYSMSYGLAHYYVHESVTAWDLGAAVAYDRDKQLLEEKILSMIQDTVLDDYSRAHLHDIFWFSLCYDQDKGRRLAGLERLAAADRTMPAYIYRRLDLRAETLEMMAGRN